jgi:hypothetical protein
MNSNHIAGVRMLGGAAAKNLQLFDEIWDLKEKEKTQTLSKKMMRLWRCF